jgi:hypothetical protein
MEKPAEVMLKDAELYKEFIAKARKLGANKRSYNSLRQEFHEYAQIYPLPNLAVELCVQSFTLAAQEQVEKKAKPELVLKAGRLAYCAMMPKLVNRESIRDFIACVVNGMAMDIIPGPEGTRLLYGAQVAQAALPPVRRWRKNAAQPASKPAEKCTQTAPNLHPDPTSTHSLTNT